MPLWLYLAVLGLVVVSFALVTGCGFAIGARICGGRKGGLRLVIAGSVFYAVAVTLGIACQSAPLWIALIALIGWVLVPTLLVRSISGLRGWRLAGATVLALILPLAVLLCLVFPLRWTIFDSYRIPTGSMAPAVIAGDRVAVDRTLKPRRWDIIVFRAPNDAGMNRISRLVGLPGETIELR